MSIILNRIAKEQEIPFNSETKPYLYSLYRFCQNHSKGIHTDIATENGKTVFKTFFRGVEGKTVIFIVDEATCRINRAYAF